MNFICNQHSNACLIRHHYQISHARYLTDTESLKKQIRCSTLLTVAPIVWQRRNQREARSNCLFKMDRLQLIIFLPRFWHVICKENGCGIIHHLSITPAFMGVGCVLCSPPQSAELPLRSDISKLDCTGLKVDPFRNRWPYIAVFGLF